MMKQSIPKPRRGFFGSTAFTRRGASLIEVSIAVAIVAISALAAGSFFSQQLSLTRNLTRNSSCKAALDSQLAYIREMGASGSGYEWKGLSEVASSDFRITPPTSIAGDRWAADNYRLGPVREVDIVSGNGAVKQLNTHRLAKGSVGFLAALYNSVSGISSGVDITTIARAGAFPFPAHYDEDSLKDFRSTIRITTFNVGTGDDESSGTQTWLRPQGLNPNALATEQVGSFDPNSTARYGYRVRLVGSFTDPTGATKSCEASEDFFYPVDLESPKLSVILNAYDPTFDRASFEPFDQTGDPNVFRTRPECSQTPAAVDAARLTLEVGFQTNAPDHKKMEAGTIFMCRDVSEQLAPDYCRGAPGAQMDGFHYPDPANPPRWVPCNEVTACGMLPATVRFEQTAPGAVKYTLNYTNANRGSSRDGLWGCDIKLDVATIDAAGNFDLLSSKRYPNNGNLFAIQGHFFQQAPCYACYKKKPFSFLTLALVIGGGLLTAGAGLAVATTALAAVGAGVAAGGIIACAAGIGGACRLKGYNFKRNSCDIPSGYQLNRGSKMCRKVTPRYPTWYRKEFFPNTSAGGTALGQACDAGNWSYPDTSRGGLSVPAGTPDGETVSDSYLDLPNGISCTISAVCQNGTWVPEEDVPQIVTCNALKTAVQLDSNFDNPRRVCVLEVPSYNQSRLIDRSYYNHFTDVCNTLPDGVSRRCYRHYPGHSTTCLLPTCVDNRSGNVCNRSNTGPGRYCDEYPADALDDSVINQTGIYTYFENYNPTTDGSLTMCETAAQAD